MTNIKRSCSKRSKQYSMPVFTKTWSTGSKYRFDTDRGEVYGLNGNGAVDAIWANPVIVERPVEGAPDVQFSEVRSSNVKNWHFGDGMIFVRTDFPTRGSYTFRLRCMWSYWKEVQDARNARNTANLVEYSDAARNARIN